MLTFFPMRDIPARIHGRTIEAENGVPLYFTGAAVELCVTGTELWLEYEAAQNGGDFLRIEIDGFEFIRFMLDAGVHRVCIFRHFPAAQTFRVRVLREMQASGSALTIRGFLADGGFSEVPARRHKIEFLGDSVTSGEGLAGAKSLDVWIPQVFSSRGNYAIAAADAVDADYSIVSMSGWGLFSSWDNNRDNVIPAIYDKVCAPAGVHTPWSFDDGVDVVVIKLGANDGSAFGGKPYILPDGTEQQLRLGEDGKPHPDDLALFIDAVNAFHARLRALRPAAKQVWCVGRPDEKVMGYLRAAVEAFGDSNVHIVETPSATDELRAARNHPSAAAHRIYADALIAKLKEILD